MTTACPKCRHVREADATVPSWQCPKCGVAYAKAADAVAPAPNATSWTPSARSRSADGAPWGKMLLGAVVLGAALTAFQRLPAMASGPDMAKLATSTGPGDVVMFTTSTCPYCKQAASWMSQYGFAFTECNTETHAACAQTFQSYGGNGVPYLVVKGHHMKNGFNSDEFLEALTP
jgi:glutaredoxin